MRRQPEKAVQVLDLMLQLFEGGAHWTRCTYKDRHGNFCLVGGMMHIRDHWRIRGADTSHYLKRAVGARTVDEILDYNDDSDSFERIEAAIRKARELASRDIGEECRPQRKRKWRCPTITEAEPLAVMAEPDCAELAKLEAAEATKRRLLAEIELERVARAATGDTRPTYILRPEPPSNYRVSKVNPSAEDTPKNQPIRAPRHVSLSA
jgi:hypothetical protein